MAEFCDTKLIYRISTTMWSTFRGEATTRTFEDSEAIPARLMRAARVGSRIRQLIAAPCWPFFPWRRYRRILRGDGWAGELLLDGPGPGPGRPGQC